MEEINLEYKRLSQVDLRGGIGTRIFVIFMASGVTVKNQKNGKKYLLFNMVDKDTVLESKIFDANDAIISKVVDGKVYRGAVDISVWDKAPNGVSGIVYNFEDAPDNPQDFLNWAPDMLESKRTIERAIVNMGDTFYQDVTLAIVNENWNKLSTWTAAASMHHTRLGDLLTHTAEVVQLADVVADVFNEIYGEDFINKPLLLSACILHDIGKTIELDVDLLSGTTTYSRQSSLSTHIMDAISMVDEYSYTRNIGKQVYTDELDEETYCKTAEQIESEIEALNLLKHAIASHHGKLEWGAMIEPSIPEAYLLHMLDTMDAEMFRYNKVYSGIQSGEVFSKWTPDGLKKYYKELTK